MVDGRTRVLVLGSLPGVRSLAARRYYAHPTNQFWRLIGGVIGSDITALRYEERLAALLKAGVGLWDSVADAERRGSLDSAIRAARPAPLAALVATLPELAAVAFNGAASARIGLQQIAGAGEFACVQLPSSSAAYCRISLAEKHVQWNSLREFLPRGLHSTGEGPS